MLSATPFDFGVTTLPEKPPEIRTLPQYAGGPAAWHSGPSSSVAACWSRRLTIVPVVSVHELVAASNVSAVSSASCVLALFGDPPETRMSPQ